MVMTSEQLKRMVFPGESGGDYNALFGYANRPGGQFEGVRLTDMTVNQALQFSDPIGPYAQSVRGQIGRVATPMGAYQVVGKTLRAAMNGMGLTGNERMTPELQDQIGMWIYQNQGPGAWEAWGGGGSGSASSGKGGAMPMGLFDMQEEPQTFGQRLKRDFQSGELMDRIALAANTLRMDPDQNLAQMIQIRQEKRGEKDTANRTAQWLMSQNREDLAQALMTGALDAKTAVATALQKPDKANVMEVGGKLVDETGRVVYDPTGGAAPTLTSDQLGALNTLRDDATVATKELGLMKDAWENVNAFYQNPGAVSDRALVIAFAKILDPTSVVRESESAAIANSGAFDEGMKALLQNALQGQGNLPPDIRSEIVSLARTMYANKFPGAQQRVELLKETARRAGLPEDLVFPGTLTPPSTVAIPTNTGGTIPAPLTFTPAP